MKTLLLVLTTLLLASCSSMNASWVKNSPAENWMYIHKNPKAGDYSILVNQKYSLWMKYEVVALENNLVHIKVGFVKTSGMGTDYLKNLEWHYLVDLDGFVKEAWGMVDGEKVPRKIVQKNNDAYIEPNFKELNNPEIISLDKKEYKVTHLTIFSSISEMGLASVKITCTAYMNRDMPFGIIRMYETDSVKMSILDLLNYIGKINSTAKFTSMITNYIVEKNDPYHSTWDLAEASR